MRAGGYYHYAIIPFSTLLLCKQYCLARIWWLTWHSNIDHYLTNDHYLITLMIFIHNVVNLYSQKSVRAADEKL